MIDQQKYGNDWERTVIGQEDIHPIKYAREISRYKYASQYVKPGMNILEIGCSSGFGTRLLTKGINYTGVDYDKTIVEYATEHFGNDTTKFIHQSIDEFLATNTIKWDVIIAFEVLEHVKNGKEVAQELKKHCKMLLASSPYMEPVGLWGKHHVLHGLRETDFPEFEYNYVLFRGTIKKKPDLNSPNLLLMKWEEGKEYPRRKTILCCIPTKNRRASLLHCLQSIALQTVKPDKVIIYDDGDHYDIRVDPIGKYMGPLLLKHGIEWEVMFMPGKGQHVAHEVANMSGFDFVWRMDDDGVAEPDVLERLLSYMDDDVGAVAGACYELDKQIFSDDLDAPEPGKIENFFDTYNFQWAPDQGSKEVDWLYSSFLYRAGIVHYKSNMSPVAFHEETIFTHRLKRAGYRLIVDTSIYTYHFKCPSGGCRAEDHKWAYAWDNIEFIHIMEREWGIKCIALRGGIGDNFALLNIIPELKEKYPKLIIATCHPEVYQDCNIKTMPWREDLTDELDLYAWMTEHNWTGTIVEALRKMYL